MVEANHKLMDHAVRQVRVLQLVSNVLSPAGGMQLLGRDVRTEGRNELLTFGDGVGELKFPHHL